MIIKRNGGFQVWIQLKSWLDVFRSYAGTARSELGANERYDAGGSRESLFCSERARSDVAGADAKGTRAGRYL